jgi:hypothetical protein
LAEAGWPDVVALAPGGRGLSAPVVLIECKAAKGVLSKKQREFRAWCDIKGHEYRVVRCVEDIEEVIRG